MSLLHIGDIISLYSDGFLSTLGLVDDRCVLQPSKGEENEHEIHPPKKFRDCLFKVCNQHKYDVQSELWRSGQIEEELYKKLYAAAKSEQDSNQEKNQLKKGTVVKYEDTIQLLHIKSNKYITVNTKAAAPCDKNAIRVYLDSNGNEGSWLKVKSPYKYRSNGEDVVCESIALVSELMGVLNHEDALYLHASTFPLPDNPDCLEINANRQSTSWDVKPFLDYTEDLEDFLKGGDVVRLFHTDQEKFLTMDTYNNQETQHVFLRSTDRAKATSATSSKALWEVEVVEQDPCRAGLARWNSLIRLKHLATERFLAAEQDDDPTPDSMREKLRQKGREVYKLISIEFSCDLATLFEFDPTTMNVNKDAYIPIHSNITLKHLSTSTYAHSTNIYIDKEKKKSCMSKVGCAHQKGLDEVFAVIPVSATEIRDLDFVYDACMLLDESFDLIQQNDTVGRIEAHRKLAELLPEIIHFIANKESEPRKIEKALSMIAENPNRERQKLLREQNVLKVLFDILKLEDGLNANKDICRLCYRVLRLSFQNYRKNQEYIVGYDEFMQDQFGKDISAESTYSTLFHSNKNLLEKHVNKVDIDKFISLIRSKRQSHFLDCLSDLCITCNGSVSSQTQKLICESILYEESKNSDILIDTIQSDTNQIFLSTEHWSTFEGYNFAKEVRCFRKPLIDIVLAARNKSEMDIFIFDYYRHQIDLFSAMCVSRQTKAISILSEKLSLQLIQQCISDARLPYELRASFCRLLLHLYLIVEPRKPVSPVNLRRHWKDVYTNIKVDVDVYDHHHDRDSTLKHFDTTMEFVELYLSDLTSLSSRSSPSIYYNNERNKLTFEVINLTRELTYFGFYRLSDFLRLAETLLIVLEDEKNQQKLVMKTKTKIIEILQYMSEVRLDYMITCLLTIFKSNQKLNPNGELVDTSNQTAKNIHQALDEHSKKVNLDGKSGKKFVSVLLHLVKHDCPDLVSASLELLLNFRSQRNRILETFRKIELINSTSDIQESFWKIHPLIEQLNKYHRNGRDENHNVVNEVLVKESKLVSFIVQHIQYLIRNKDEERLTRDLLCLLKDLIPLDAIQGVPMGYNSNNSSNSNNNINSNSNGNRNGSNQHNKQNNGCTNNSTKIDGRSSEDLKRKINESIPTMDDIQSLSMSCNSSSSNSSNSNSNGSGKLITQNSSSTNNRHKSEAFVSSIEPSEIQNKLDTHGTSSLVVELIAMGSSCCEEKVRERSAAVFNDTIALGIALLDGGNQLIQTSIYDKLTKKNELDKSERFFEVLGNRMSLAMQALSPTGGSCSKSNNNYMGPILRLLQLLCEDHNLTMQNFIHSQVLNKTSYNLVAKTLVFLNCVCGSKEGSLGHKLGEYIKENNVDLINQTLRTLTEYCQGPCVENQRCILMHESNGIDMIRSLILDNIEPLDNLRMDLVLELKDNASKLLLALMESCSDPQHAGRILREASLTNKLINVAINYYHEQDDYDDSFAEFSNEEVLSSADGIVRPRDVGHKVFILCHQLVQQYNLIHQTVQTSAKIPTSCECLALANKGSINSTTFGNINEFQQQQQQQSSSTTTSGCATERDVHLREATALRYYESHTAQIEIVRGNRQMERVVFPVPLICEYLTHETKLNIYHNTEQDERGSKIPNFFSSIDDLFDEMKWQRELQTNPILHSIARYMSLWSSVEFKLSCLVTVLVLFCVSKQQQHLNHNHHLNHHDHQHHHHHHQQQQHEQQQQYQHEDISSSVAAAAAGCYADVTSAAANAFVEKVAAAAASMASAASTTAAGTCTGNSAAAAAAGNHSVSGSGSSFLPSSVNTLLAIACSTFFVFKPRIAHSWTLFLVCTTLYLAQVVGECNSLKILGLFLEAVTMMHLFSVLINKGYINKPIQLLLTETDVLYHGGYLLICTLGLILNPLFYPFLLPPSLIRREETLRNVIKSVTKNAYSILMTGFLGLIIILLYTIIDYLFFGEDFIIDIDDGSSSSSSSTYKPCLGTLWECYVAHVNYGLRDGGGIGERIRDTRLDLTLLNVLRLVCIMSFFLVVNLMILQLVYCIIVDTFATLRGEKQQKEEVLRNTCFVCGLDRSSFENRQTTFEDHIRSEHNLWHYLYFIVLIKTKSRTELSGPESLVHDMIKNKDHSWFPRMRAMSLNKEEQVAGAVYSN